MTRQSTAHDPSGADVLATARWCADVLTGATGDWDAPIPGLEWTVRQAVAHSIQALLWYAIDLSSDGVDLPTVELRVKAESEPPDLVATMRAYAAVLAAVVDAAPPTQRGYHGYGIADPSGFAAMACDELLIHADDAARGLGVVVTPPTDLCRATVQRLFPWADAAGEPWNELRWANGRIDLPGRARPVQWRWHCAPLAEWDGTIPGQPLHR